MLNCHYAMQILQSALEFDYLNNLHTHLPYKRSGAYINNSTTLAN